METVERLKALLRRIVPRGLVHRLRAWVYSGRIRRARKIFEEADVQPGWLDISVLQELQLQYSRRTSYGYDSKSTEKRGRSRARRLLDILRQNVADSAVLLELGSWDGMIGYFLQEAGHTVTAIDLRDDGFDDRAKERGVRFEKMNAEDLRFENECFDLVFSYDAFEHFSDPEAVLSEAMRVTKKGGYIFLEFGPLYLSPMGLHAYYAVTVPYCHVLFGRQELAEFTVDNGLNPIDFSQLNQWTLERYRDLWRKYAPRLKIVFNYENLDTAYLGLIEKYPSCFKNTSREFDSYITKSIEILFQKIN